MAFASGSRLQVAYIAEVTPGTTPSTPTMKALRVKSHSLGLEKGTMQSSEIRSDRQVADVRHGAKSVKGDIGFELSAGTFDDMIEGALGGTWTTNVLKTGSTQRFFSIEVGHLDISQYRLFKGCTIDKMTLSLKPNAIVDMKMTYSGLDEVISATTAASSVTAAGTASPVDGNSALCVIQEGGSPIAIITGIDLSLDNSAKSLEVVGSNKAAGINWGQCKVSGTVTAYVQDVSLYNKFLNETSTTLSVAMSDGTKSYTILLPKVKYTGAKIDVSNEDALIQTLPFVAYYDPTEQASVKITRV